MLLSILTVSNIFSHVVTIRLYEEASLDSYQELISEILSYR